ncbi:RimJ/RimL family protein N-acetyltransferase [Mucilaginibacter yixingensis]|uniref:RimJ/RimL family protein N-acetyltransferase n=2 Tax=Mucilaginibacter yixingensis TaxID=1295612 RepID=A0A2T5JDF5_9SPHI|nr:RimJ/RimL family protein N-acetyltransferase [Mucilaginibacter yixingensis]
MQRNADNPMVARYVSDRFPSPYTMADAETWVQRWQGQDPVINFAIATDDEVIGGIGLEFRAHIYRKTPLLGYWLAEHYWGRGIMPQAVKLIVNYAFSQLDVIAIQANTFGGNVASMRVLEKAGFERQGIIKQSVIKNGEIMDEHIFAITSPQPLSKGEGPQGKLFYCS